MNHNGVTIPDVFPRFVNDDRATPLRQFNPTPSAPNLNDEVYRQFVADELRKVIAITLAFTAVARYVPGPVGIAARLFAVASLGTPGETKKGSIGGAKTNLLPAPFGFADPKVYGLKPNFWIPAGSTQVVPQVFDLVGLGLNEQRYDDMRADERVAIDRMRHFRTKMSSLPFDEWKKQDSTRPQPWAKPFALEWYFGQYQDIALHNIAIKNERLYRSNPKLRHAVNNSGWTPMGVITSDQIEYLIAFDEAVLAGSLQPERIEPVNAKAIENAELARGIRRELVTERADP